jgi:hypothetical protein
MPFYAEAISAPTNAESQHARTDILFCEVEISGFVADTFDDLLCLGIRFLRVSCSSSVHDGYDQPGTHRFELCLNCFLDAGARHP